MSDAVLGEPALDGLHDAYRGPDGRNVPDEFLAPILPKGLNRPRSETYVIELLPEQTAGRGSVVYRYSQDMALGEDRTGE